MLTGGCQCDAVRHEVTAAPLRIYVCHRTECRAQSSSAFGISVIVPSGAVRLIRGKPREWSRLTANGQTLVCAFCPDCGGRVWHRNAPQGDDMSIKGGSLGHPVDLTGAIHIWTQSKLPGVAIPDGALQFSQDHD